MKTSSNKVLSLITLLLICLPPQAQCLFCSFPSESTGDTVRLQNVGGDFAYGEVCEIQCDSTTYKAIRKCYGRPDKRSQEWVGIGIPFVGNYVMTIVYDSLGMELEFDRVGSINRRMTVKRIRLFAPYQVRLQGHIGIGSSYADFSDASSGFGATIHVMEDPGGEHKKYAFIEYGGVRYYSWNGTSKEDFKVDLISVSCI